MSHLHCKYWSIDIRISEFEAFFHRSFWLGFPCVQSRCINAAYGGPNRMLAVLCKFWTLGLDSHTKVLCFPKVFLLCSHLRCGCPYLLIEPKHIAYFAPQALDVDIQMLDVVWQAWGRGTRYGMSVSRWRHFSVKGNASVGHVDMLHCKAMDTSVWLPVERANPPVYHVESAFAVSCAFYIATCY